MSKGRELTQVLQNARIEGPSRTQARKMATLRMELLDRARTAETAGNDDLAFTLDCHAFDIECDLRTYGYESLIK